MPRRLPAHALRLDISSRLDKRLHNVGHAQVRREHQRRQAGGRRPVVDPGWSASREQPADKIKSRLVVATVHDGEHEGGPIERGHAPRARARIERALQQAGVERGRGFVQQRVRGDVHRNGLFSLERSLTSPARSLADSFACVFYIVHTEAVPRIARSQAAPGAPLAAARVTRRPWTAPTTIPGMRGLNSDTPQSAKVNTKPITRHFRG